MSQKATKIMAIIALFCIVASVVWTGILFIVSWNKEQEIQISPEELQQIIQQQNQEEENTSSWTQIIETNTELTWTWTQE